MSLMRYPSSAILGIVVYLIQNALKSRTSYLDKTKLHGIVYVGNIKLILIVTQKHFANEFNLKQIANKIILQNENSDKCVNQEFHSSEASVNNLLFQVAP